MRMGRTTTVRSRHEMRAKRYREREALVGVGSCMMGRVAVALGSRLRHTGPAVRPGLSGIGAPPPRDALPWQLCMPGSFSPRFRGSAAAVRHGVVCRSNRQVRNGSRALEQRVEGKAASPGPPPPEVRRDPPVVADSLLRPEGLVFLPSLSTKAASRTTLEWPPSSPSELQGRGSPRAWPGLGTP